VEPPSGKQFELRRGRQRAVVVEVGAGLREYEVAGQPVLDGYPLHQMADGARGQPLLPWPNRLADGRYEFGGQTLQLPIDEVARNNASHGLTRWLNWNAVAHTTDQIRFELVLHSRPGYPFTLQLQIWYLLTNAGLTVRTSARNLGSEALPFGAGQHPYFTAGTELVDSASLKVPAHSRLELDPERRLPTSRTLSVAQSAFDFGQSRPIGTLVLDDCFADLSRDPDGHARVVLSASDSGKSVSVWLDEHYRYVQLFSGDTLAPDRRRRGLAIEPMTCPPNALRSGTDLIVLQPGGAIELEWGIQIDNGLTAG
jgi:aldose 1-epimerase